MNFAEDLVNSSLRVNLKQHTENSLPLLDVSTSWWPAWQLTPFTHLLFQSLLGATLSPYLAYQSFGLVVRHSRYRHIYTSWWEAWQLTPFTHLLFQSLLEALTLQTLPLPW